MKQPDSITLFLCGDVMTGRGIDQILPHPSAPQLHESYMHSALEYVSLAQHETGPISRPVEFGYIWGDAMPVLERMKPDVRIINLETAVTTSEDAWREKGVHYRMHPANTPCLTAAGVQCCVTANNHVLDWGYRGLEETLRVVRAAGMVTAGAGIDDREAAAPAVVASEAGRVLVFAFGMESAGVPYEWIAGPHRPGVNLLTDLSARSADAIAQQVARARRSADIVVVSLHWGGNWGYEVAQEHRAFARHLIDAGAADVVHGHSSHHPMGIEVYRERPIIYGCGDFLNDYEGIRGHESYRSELTLMYFVTLEVQTGRLSRLLMTPMQIRHFRLHQAQAEEARWLQGVLDRECRKLGTRLTRDNTKDFRLLWTD